MFPIKCLIYKSSPEVPGGCQAVSPAQGDFDGRGQAGGEEVGGQVRIHGQELVGLAGRQLDAVLHGRGQRHLGQRVIGVYRCHLQDTDNINGTAPPPENSSQQCFSLRTTEGGANSPSLTETVTVKDG